MRRKLLLEVIVLLMFCGILVNAPKIGKASGEVAINETTFPDSIIRQRVSEVADQNKDGKLSVKERLSVKKVWFADKYDYYNTEDGISVDVGVKDIKGIDLFPNLEEIELWAPSYATLNLKQLANNNKLRKIRVVGDSVGSVNIGKVSFPDGNVIETIDLTQVKIQSLDVKNCCKLESLSISPESSNFSKLDVTKNTKLKKLYVNGAKLTKLYLSKNKHLTYLDCSGNKIKKLNLKNNKKLIYLDCSGNRYTKINLSHNKKLKYLTCTGIKLKSINLTKNTKHIISQSLRNLIVVIIKY